MWLRSCFGDWLAAGWPVAELGGWMTGSLSGWLLDGWHRTRSCWQFAFRPEGNSQPIHLPPRGFTAVAHSPNLWTSAPACADSYNRVNTFISNHMMKEPSTVRTDAAHYDYHNAAQEDSN